MVVGGVDMWKMDQDGLRKPDIVPFPYWIFPLYPSMVTGTCSKLSVEKKLFSTEKSAFLAGNV